MSNFEIISNRNSPIVGLQQQIGQIGSQIKEHSKYDTGVISFNNQKVNKDEEMKLYTPVRIDNSTRQTSKPVRVETFYNYHNYYNNRNNRNNVRIILLIFVIIALLIFFWKMVP